jgi:hypothetical protein
MGLQSPRNLYRTVKYPGRIFINFLNHIQLTSVYQMVGLWVAIAQLVTNYYIRISKEKKNQHFLKRKLELFFFLTEKEGCDIYFFRRGMVVRFTATYAISAYHH